MKNQYFGDKRDLVKYELLLDLIKVTNIKKFCFVPMLTQADSTREGNLRHPNRKIFRKELIDFLEKHQGNKNIMHWREFFHNLPIRYVPYRDDFFYSYETRHEYFSKIQISALECAIVFVDPDVGLEIESVRSMKNRGENGIDKYLFYEECRTLWELCDNSILVIYQHLQNDRHKRLADLVRKGDRLASQLQGSSGIFVMERDLGFLIISNRLDKNLATEIRDCIEGFVKKLRKDLPDPTDVIWGAIN